jgi:hypothetical protein
VIDVAILDARVSQSFFFRVPEQRPRTVCRCQPIARDPSFATKLADIVGLYLDPPAHAVVLSIDEKSQIRSRWSDRRPRSPE